MSIEAARVSSSHLPMLPRAGVRAPNLSAVETLPTSAGEVPAVLAGIEDQPTARALLGASAPAPLHAYLFLGPPGSGKHEAALAFAAVLLCPNGGCGGCGACQAALDCRHPDLVVVERSGAAISVEEAREIRSLAQRSPRLASRQVIVLSEFHLVDEAAPALLKTLEEPPATTVFLVLADALPARLATIASRCARVEFRPLDSAAIERRLVREGVDPAVALAAAAGAGGRLDRARLLVNDPGFGARQERWRRVPARLDGQGSTIHALGVELLAGIDELAEVVKAHQSDELNAARAAAEANGERSSVGRQAMEDRHRREQRRLRTDELRAGLAALQASYRNQLRATSPPGQVARVLACDAAIERASAALGRNPNEALLLQGLLVELDALRP